MRAFLSALLLLLLFCTPLHAQTQVSKYRPGLTPEGIVYYLPKTALRISVLTERTTFTAGELARYADRYLRLNDVGMESFVTHRVVGLTVTPIGVADTSKCYVVPFNVRTAASNMVLSDEGTLLAVNAEPLPAEEHRPFRPAPRPQPADPRRYLSQEILTAGSSAKKAELTADDIYEIRESRNLLSRGQADFMPKDGEQLRLMLQTLDRQEQALTQLFVGTTERDTTELTIVFAPDGECKNHVLFRLSKQRGLVDIDDLSGTPYYIDIEDLHMLPAPAAEPMRKKKEPENGIYVNAPGRMRATIRHSGQQPVVYETQAAQFGRAELLSGSLFDRRFTTHLTLHPVTGSVERLEAELPK